MLFVGDMMFDRSIRLAMEKEGDDFILTCVGNLLQDADITIGNLEGPITSYPSVSVGTVPGSPDNFYFTFPTSTARLLARHGFDAVSIGNNHIGNFDLSGIDLTKKYLDEAGVRYFGGLAGDEPIYHASINDLSVAFISYNEFGGAKPDEIAQAVKQEKDGGRIVIVYAHWGDEYVEPAPRVRAAAELFAASGAAVIIGSHPHVVLSSEYIGKTLVYWSLGNFVFDQYWDASVSTGLMVKIAISGNGAATVSEQPVVLRRNGQTCPLPLPESV